MKTILLSSTDLFCEAMTTLYEQFDNLSEDNNTADASDDADWTMGDISAPQHQDVRTLSEPDPELGKEINGNAINHTSVMESVDPFDVGIPANGQIQYIPDGKDMKLSKHT